MTDHGFESLGDVLKRLGVKSLLGGDDPLAAEDYPDPSPDCSRCRDSGWLSRGGVAVECPCGIVQQRRSRVIFAHSQVPESMRGYSLDSFAERSGRADLATDIRAAWDGGDARWLLLAGPVGVGKTGIAVSLLNEQLEAGRGGLYIVVPTLLTFIRSTYGPQSDDGLASETAVMSGLAQTPLLVLDDLGKARLSEWGQEKLYTILNERYIHERRTIVTSNLDIDDGTLEDHLWPATFDRLRGMSDIFRLSGESLR